jgi:hypothetical protein
MIKELFKIDGEYLRYNGKIVARFKYSKKLRPSFRKFLINNFTTEEYFAAKDSGIAPFDIAEAKGWNWRTA